jgi:CheY-like chemotaxis protein
MNEIRILVVEDEDAKYADVVAVLESLQLEGVLELLRAKNAIEAESILERGGLSLMILDISLNISPGSLGPLRGGFANLGGLSVAERMYMLGQSLKAVVVTGFDYFPTVSARQGNVDLVSLKDIETRAAKAFGKDYFGCVRYGVDGWEGRLARCVVEAINS